MGGGLFDLSGDLQGVVLPCDDGPAIVPVSEIQRAMASVNNDVGRTLARYGFQLANPKADDETGVLVTEVWEQWPASHAGIEPADELIAIDGQSIALPHDALAILLQSGTTSHQVAVRRGRRSFTANLATTLNNSAEAHPAVTVEDQPGLAIANVSKGSSADQAGLRIGDRVLSIDGRPATKAKLQQAFADFQVSNPFEVVVQRPGRRTLFTVRP
jgi:S1-C subfamily serine protease